MSFATTDNTDFTDETCQITRIREIRVIRGFFEGAVYGTPPHIFARYLIVVGRQEALGLL